LRVRRDRWLAAAARKANYCVDLDRMYATGQSNGGMMTYQIGATLAHRLAAIAPISGSLHWNYAVQPTEPIPVFAVTGTQDSTVPANGTANGKVGGGGGRRARRRVARAGTTRRRRAEAPSPA
jgi:poly(3-hydroxybutyrate) depolymerase